MKKLAIAATLAIASVGAQAQFYAEAGLTNLSIKGDVTGGSIKSSPKMFGLVLGYEVHPNLAVEGLLGFNASDDSIQYNGTSVPNSSAKVSDAFGVYLKPKTMVTDNLEIFGRLGWTKAKSTAAVGGTSESDTSDDFGYGVGASYYFDKKTYGTVSYTSFSNKDGNKTTGITIGVGYRF